MGAKEVVASDYPLAVLPHPSRERRVLPADYALTIPRSAAAYRGANLRLYDWFVLRFTSPYAWGCTADELADMYRQHMRTNHAEVGVGSGYFLRNSQQRMDWSELSLIDPNPAALAYVVDRLATPVNAHTSNILVRDSLPNRQFQSVAANYVLHCLPDTGSSKRTAIANLAHLTADEGVLFGATVLGVAAHNPLGRALMRGCNSLELFGNTHDSEAALRQNLERSFRDVHIERRRTVAMFTASGPIR